MAKIKGRATLVRAKSRVGFDEVNSSVNDHPAKAVKYESISAMAFLKAALL
jgi:hypothetical protein